MGGGVGDGVGVTVKRLGGGRHLRQLRPRKTT